MDSIPDVSTELLSLLSVMPEEIEGLLQEIRPPISTTYDDISFKFHYIRFKDGLPRLDSFISKICDLIPNYCIRRKRISNARPSDWRRLLKEATSKFVRSDKTGEPGELISYFLLEGVIKVPKILTKMSLKTSGLVHFHGSDGIHFGQDGDSLLLYVGESKLHANYKDGIKDALDSVKSFFESQPNGITKQEFEINVVTDNIDIPEGSLRDLILNALDPYSKANSNLGYVYSCFIGFDATELRSYCDDASFIPIFEQIAISCHTYACEKILLDPILKDLQWHFFFIPFDSVDRLRQEFLREIDQV